MIKKAATIAQFAEMQTAHKKLLVDFFATWCGPCQRIGPVYTKYATDYKDKIAFAKVDVDEAGEVVDKFNITSMPTFVAFKDGKEVSRIVGGDEQQLLNFIKNLDKL